MNRELARHNMIEQQVRPGQVLSEATRQLMYSLQREDFVPAGQRHFAFSDTRIPLGHGATTLTPSLEARAVQALDLDAADQVLEIGAGSGYMAALLAARAAAVLSVEIDADVAEAARANLRHAGVHNVTVLTGDGFAAAVDRGPFDAIMVSGGLVEVPRQLVARLKPGGRLFAFVGSGPAMTAQLIRRVDDENFQVRKLFETWVAPLRHSNKAAFAF